MLGNIVPRADGTYEVYVKPVKATFEEISANVGMCIMVGGSCVGKTTGDYDADLAKKTEAENSFPVGGSIEFPYSHKWEDGEWIVLPV